MQSTALTIDTIYQILQNFEKINKLQYYIVWKFYILQHFAQKRRVILQIKGD